MSITPVESRPRGPNRATVLLRVPSAPRIEREELGRAFSRATAMFDRFAWSHPGEPGHRLFWALGGDVALLDLPARKGSYAVLGRHTEADVVLADDPEVSLRHLLARSIALADGSPALRLMDLRGSMPFFLEDGVPRRSIVASGPVVARLGLYVIGAVPQAGSTAAAGGPYRELPELEVRSSRILPVTGARGRGSYVTALPALADLASFAASTPAPSNCARLTLVRGDRAATVEVPDGDLDAGVLVGRSERCLDRGLRAVLTGSVSRAHLLLLRERGSVHAFDLCSMQGTWLEGAPVRRCRLSDSGARLVLAHEDPVVLLWHPRALA